MGVREPFSIRLGVGETGEEDGEEDGSTGTFDDLIKEDAFDERRGTVELSKDDVPIEVDGLPIPKPWQGIQRAAIVFNLAFVWDDDAEEWVRQKKDDLLAGLDIEDSSSLVLEGPAIIDFGSGLSVSEGADTDEVVVDATGGGAWTVVHRQTETLADGDSGNFDTGLTGPERALRVTARADPYPGTPFNWQGAEMDPNAKSDTGTFAYNIFFNGTSETWRIEFVAQSGTGEDLDVEFIVLEAPKS